MMSKDAICCKKEGGEKMRFKLYFTLETLQIPIQYRKCIISFFKHCLSSYNEAYYKKYYHEKDTTIKNYAFSTYYKQSQIQNENIILKDHQFELNVTTSDYETGIILYNAFHKQQHKKYPLPNNTMTLQTIRMMPEKEITTPKIVIKFQAPLCVRSRINQKDYYYSYQAKEFQDILKINIREQLKITDIPEEIVDTFEIKPINAKKVMIKFYEKCLECSIGVFEISGKKELLTYLYQAGMGSKHSAGFGMFQII